MFLSTSFALCVTGGSYARSVSHISTVKHEAFAPDLVLGLSHRYFHKVAAILAGERRRKNMVNFINRVGNVELEGRRTGNSTRRL